MILHIILCGFGKRSSYLLLQLFKNKKKRQLLRKFFCFSSIVRIINYTIDRDLSEGIGVKLIGEIVHNMITFRQQNVVAQGNGGQYNTEVGRGSLEKWGTDRSRGVTFGPQSSYAVVLLPILEILCSYAAHQRVRYKRKLQSNQFINT